MSVPLVHVKEIWQACRNKTLKKITVNEIKSVFHLTKVLIFLRCTVMQELTNRWLALP